MNRGKDFLSHLYQASIDQRLDKHCTKMLAKQFTNSIDKKFKFIAGYLLQVSSIKQTFIKKKQPKMAISKNNPITA